MPTLTRRLKGVELYLYSCSMLHIACFGCLLCVFCNRTVAILSRCFPAEIAPGLSSSRLLMEVDGNVELNLSMHGVIDLSCLNTTSSTYSCAFEVVSTGQVVFDSLNISGVDLVGGGLVRATSHTAKLQHVNLKDVAVRSTEMNFLWDSHIGLI